MGRQLLERMTEPGPIRSRTWRWGVCILLLLATTINYMDRLTLSTAASRIMGELRLNNEQYGNMEFYFGLAFAFGSLFFGFLADRMNVRILYPIILLLWSSMGFATGFAKDYDGLLLCRTLLGFFEAGHWPCGLKTVQRVLEAKHHTMGNSLLQGGASIGAIVTPLIMKAFLTPEIGSWRIPFMILGGLGVVWVGGWLCFLRSKDLEYAPGPASAQAGGDDPSIWRILVMPRFLSLVSMVVLISICWQLFRAWLPLFLEKGRGYPLQDALSFTSVFYVASEAGVLSVGAFTLWLQRRGLTVHASSSVGYAAFSLLTLLTTVAAFLPRGLALQTVLVLVAFGSLGVFPCYYAFTQELSVKSMGRVTGVLSFFAWAIPSYVQRSFGRSIDRTGSYDLGIGLVGWAPLVALAILLVLWKRDPVERRLA
jgi:ACS family hexuronate transporter-like MFS transporter